MQQHSSVEFTTQPLATIYFRMLTLPAPPQKKKKSLEKSYIAYCIAQSKQSQTYVDLATCMLESRSVYPKKKNPTLKKKTHGYKIQLLGMTVKCWCKPNLQSFIVLERETLNYQHPYISVKYQGNFAFNYW